MTGDQLHTRLLAELGKPYEIWAPGNVVTPIARQRSALLAVVELHAPVPAIYPPDAFQCGHCASLCHSGSGLACDSPDAPYPCDDIQAIADQLGLTDQGEPS